MKQMMNESFTKNENPVALLHAPVGNSQPSLSVRKGIWEEEERSRITQGEAGIGENFTATYWG